MSPTLLTATRIATTEMALSWEHLTLSEARGFITNYTILYYMTTDAKNRQRPNTMFTIVYGKTNSTTIYGLDKISEYLVQISANTVAGNGVLSMPVIVPLPGINLDCLINKFLVICININNLIKHSLYTNCYYRYMLF